MEGSKTAAAVLYLPNIIPYHGSVKIASLFQNIIDPDRTAVSKTAACSGRLSFYPVWEYQNSVFGSRNSFSRWS